jgi:glycerophosphoryl diester phosphodiesterase
MSRCAERVIAMSRLRAVVNIVLLVVAIAAALYLFLEARVQPMPDHPWFTAADARPQPLVMAHQGGDGERPSNTMSAFTHAVEIGVDVLEMDIHSTSDGVLVVIHDATIERTTDGEGRISDMTFAQLQTFDAAYHWPTLDDEEGSPIDDFPYRGTGVTIPALEEVLRAFPDLLVNIEIKQRTPSIAQPLCDLLRETEMTEQALVVSFDGATLREFRADCPEVATAAAQDEVTPFVLLAQVGLTGAYQPTAFAFQVPERAQGLTVLSMASVDAVQSRNVAVHAWTINQIDEMQRMIKYGVDGIITDYPSEVLRLLGRPADEPRASWR